MVPIGDTYSYNRRVWIYIAGYTELTGMYQFGLMEKMKVQPARRNLVNSLIAIRQSNVVKKYEDYLRTLLVRIL